MTDNPSTTPAVKEAGFEILAPPFQREYPEDRVYMVPLDAIDDSPKFNSSRGTIHPAEVLGLAGQIQEQGLLQPITIQPNPAYWDLSNWREDRTIRDPSIKPFRVVVGFRRTMAHRVNKATTIKASIKNHLSDLEARVMNLYENIQRHDLKINQEANAIKHFVMARWTDKQIGQKIGKPARWVLVRRQFLDLPREVQDDIVEELVSQADIGKIHNAYEYGEEAMKAAARQYKDDRILKKKTRSSPKDILKKTKVEKRIRDTDEIIALQSAVQDACGRVDDPMAMVLGFCIAYVDDYEAHKAIQEYIRKHYDRHYMIPTYAQAPVKG